MKCRSGLANNRYDTAMPSTTTAKLIGVIICITIDYELWNPHAFPKCQNRLCLQEGFRHCREQADLSQRAQPCMTLAKLDISNVRNIESANIAPSPRLNFIVGPNGSGKTSLLEAIHILGRARSFRSTQAGLVIRLQQDELTVTGRVRDGQGLDPIPLGVRLGRRKREIAERKIGRDDVDALGAGIVRTQIAVLVLCGEGDTADAEADLDRTVLDFAEWHVENALETHENSFELKRMNRETHG